MTDLDSAPGPATIVFRSDWERDAWLRTVLEHGGGHVEGSGIEFADAVVRAAQERTELVPLADWGTARLKRLARDFRASAQEHDAGSIMLAKWAFEQCADAVDSILAKDQGA